MYSTSNGFSKHYHADTSYYDFAIIRTSFIVNSTDLILSQKPESCNLKHNDPFPQDIVIYGSNRSRSKECDFVTIQVCRCVKQCGMVQVYALQWRKQTNTSVLYFSIEGTWVANRIHCDNTRDIFDSFRLFRILYQKNMHFWRYCNHNRYQLSFIPFLDKSVTSFVLPDALGNE